jgi:predicted phosphodiesterase
MTKYAILSDIHANTDALNVVLEKCRELEVDKYVCLGDIVGYNAEPKECIQMIRDLNPVAVVKGNHDDYASRNDDRMDGFNPHAQRAVIWTKNQLDDEERAYLASLPLRRTIPGTNITAVHATLDSPDTWGYIFDSHHAANNFTYQFTQLCFCGHSHVPLAFCKRPITSMIEKPIDEILEWAYNSDDGMFPRDPSIPDEVVLELKTGYKYLLNVGSVGQPRNHDPRASFAVYDIVEKTVTRYRLPYDIESAQAKILSAELPERLAIRLSNGN